MLRLSYLMQNFLWLWYDSAVCCELLKLSSVPMLPNTTSKSRRRLKKTKFLDIQLDRTTGLKHLLKADELTPNDTQKLGSRQR